MWVPKCSTKEWMEEGPTEERPASQSAVCTDFVLPPFSGRSGDGGSHGPRCLALQPFDAQEDCISLW